MKRTLTIAAMFFVFASSVAFSADEVEPDADANEAQEAEVEVTEDAKDTRVRNSSNQAVEFCFFSGTPPSDAKYTIVRRLKIGKGTYGGVKEILPKFANRAKQLGADAVINYTGSQRFGFWPWRVVRPVVRGVAIKWNDPKHRNCTTIGGTTLETILATDAPPPQ